MTTRFSFVFGLIAIGVLAGIGRSGPVAAAAQHDSTTHGAVQPSAPDAQTTMKMHEKMMVEMKAAEARLGALVTAMNAAKGDARLDAVAAAVTEIVAQQKVMHARMDDMHQHMMAGGMMMRR